VLQTGKTVVLIDGQNFYATAKALGFDIDYKKLLAHFGSMSNLLRVKYYTTVDEDDEHSSIIPLIDWLDYNGYSVVTKARKAFVDAEGRRRFKGSMDVEISVDAMELSAYVDQIVLCSGDGDFRSLIEALQKRGIRVTVISSIASQPPMCADELRRQADEFIDLVSLRAKIGRAPATRPSPGVSEMPRYGSRDTSTA
jgi:uncharacterized LabA/DUF88 family protein